jgi:hypothetical protein
MVNQKIVKYPALNEKEFYEVYLTLDNLLHEDNERLSDKAIKLLAAYMSKPLDFAIQFNNKKTIVNRTTGEKKTLAVELGEEIGILPSYTYYLMKELRDKDALVIDEDNLLRPNSQLTKLRVGTKASLSKNDVMQFDYIFKAKIVEDDDANESNLPKSSQ